MPFFEVFVINREKSKKVKIRKDGFPYHSRRIFRKVSVFLERGVVPVVVDRRLVG